MTLAAMAAGIVCFELRLGAGPSTLFGCWGGLRYKAKASACLTSAECVCWSLTALAGPACLNLVRTGGPRFRSISSVSVAPCSHWPAQSANTAPAEISVNTVRACSILTILLSVLCLLPSLRPSLFLALYRTVPEGLPQFCILLFNF